MRMLELENAFDLNAGSVCPWQGWSTSVEPSCTFAALFHRLDLTRLFKNRNVLLCIQRYIKCGNFRNADCLTLRSNEWACVSVGRKIGKGKERAEGTRSQGGWVSPVYTREEARTERWDSASHQLWLKLHGSQKTTSTAYTVLRAAK